MSECEHPKGRIRYTVVDEYEERENGIYHFPLIVGMCCDCGEVPYERRLRKPKKVKLPTNVA